MTGEAEQTRDLEREWTIYTSDGSVPRFHAGPSLSPTVVVPKARALAAESERDRYRAALERIEDYYLGTPGSLTRAALKGTPDD